MTPTGIDVEITVSMNGNKVSACIKLATGLPSTLEFEEDPFTIDADYEAKTTTPGYVHSFYI